MFAKCCTCDTGNFNNHTDVPGNVERSGACGKLVIQQAVQLGQDGVAVK